jgi:hypothetical protein
LTLPDFLVGSWEQAESSAVEDDGNAGVFAAAGAEGVVLDRLDLAVQPFAGGIGDTMLEVGQHHVQLTLQHAPLSATAPAANERLIVVSRRNASPPSSDADHATDYELRGMADRQRGSSSNNSSTSTSNNSHPPTG